MASQPRLKDSLRDLTDRIVASYREAGPAKQPGESSLPSYQAVIEIAQDLKEVLFPGFQSRRNVQLGNVACHVGGLIDSLCGRLVEQIACALQCRHEQR